MWWLSASTNELNDVFVPNFPGNGKILNESEMLLFRCTQVHKGRHTNLIIKTSWANSFSSSESRRSGLRTLIATSWLQYVPLYLNNTKGKEKEAERYYLLRIWNDITFDRWNQLTDLHKNQMLFYARILTVEGWFPKHQFHQWVLRHDLSLSRFAFQERRIAA